MITDHRNIKTTKRNIITKIRNVFTEKGNIRTSKGYITTTKRNIITSIRYHQTSKKTLLLTWVLQDAGLKKSQKICRKYPQKTFPFLYFIVILKNGKSFC